MTQENSEFSPLVSIVIPVYNGANFLSEAIDSALKQTYRNIEILVVNDGSNDGGETRKIALSYGDRIRYYEKENGGCATALNYGIDHMRGQYFSWLSHDDKYLPDKIEHQINCLKQLSNKKTIVYGGYQVIDKDSKILYPVCPERALPHEKLNISLLPLLRGLIHGCALLIPSELFKEIGVFDASLPSTQDYALWFDFFRACPIRFADRQLVLSRVHPDQGTHKIAKHIEECNDLWSGFLRRLTEREMIEMEGTAYCFMIRTAAFLDGTPYADAAKLARTMADEMLNATKISVVIPFYNRVGWTVEAIRSVLRQTHQNFEILLIDDGSTDDLTSLFNFTITDPRIKYIRQDNAGPAVARNYGIKLATGRYIAFLDSDDFFLPEKLAAQLRYMEENRFLVSHTSYLRLDLELNPLGAVSAAYFSGDIFPRVISSCPIAMPTVMASAELLKKNFFPEYLHIGEDVCLWITLASKCEWGAIETPLSSVRVGPSTAACDPRKQCLGLVGIAHFVLADPVLSGYHRQIKSLLLVAQTYLTEDSPGQAPALTSGGCHVRHTLWAKFRESLRNDGLGPTLQRVKQYLKR